MGGKLQDVHPPIVIVVVAIRAGAAVGGAAEVITGAARDAAAHGVVAAEGGGAFHRAVRMEPGDDAARLAAHNPKVAPDDDLPVRLHRGRPDAVVFSKFRIGPGHIGIERRIKAPRDLRVDRGGEADGKSQGCGEDADERFQVKREFLQPRSSRRASPMPARRWSERRLRYFFPGTTVR